MHSMGVTLTESVFDYTLQVSVLVHPLSWPTPFGTILLASLP